MKNGISTKHRQPVQYGIVASNLLYYSLESVRAGLYGCRAMPEFFGVAC